jgi:hypothetical protein
VHHVQKSRKGRTDAPKTWFLGFAGVLIDDSFGNDRLHSRMDVEWYRCTALKVSAESNVSGENVMEPFVCAACGRILTHGIWDKHTESVYCGGCIAPLPQRRPGFQPSIEVLLKMEGVDDHREWS